MPCHPPNLIRRVHNPAVALETTLLLHGVPNSQAPALARDLANVIRNAGAHPAIVGLLAGVPIVGMTDSELALLLDADSVPKANASNLAALIFRKSHAATTVSATLELAAAAAVTVFATGAIGGVHKDFASSLDISPDLIALTRFPLAVVTSGVKSLLDVHATREALESLAIPVIGFQTDLFPAFYRRSAETAPGADPITVDARFDSVDDLARFLRHELARSNRAVLVANPIPEKDEVPLDNWRRWLAQAESDAARLGVRGRRVTPFLLDRLHEISAGATLRANISLALSNAALAGALANAMSKNL